MLGLRQIFSTSSTTSICWSAPQRSISKKNAVLRKMGLPEQPKKPLTGFLVYCKTVRPQVTAENPDMSPQDVMKVLAKKWRREPDHEKQKYSKDFEAKMRTYKTEIDTYNRALTDEVKEEMRELVAEEQVRKSHISLLKKLKEKEKELKKPKRPLTAFLAFIMKTNVMGKGSEALKEASRKWKEMSKSERDKYQAEVDREMIKYKEDLLKWEAEMLAQGNIDFVKLKTIRNKLQSYA